MVRYKNKTNTVRFRHIDYNYFMRETNLQLGKRNSKLHSKYKKKSHILT